MTHSLMREGVQSWRGHWDAAIGWLTRLLGPDDPAAVLIGRVHGRVPWWRDGPALVIRYDGSSASCNRRSNSHKMLRDHFYLMSSEPGQLPWVLKVVLNVPERFKDQTYIYVWACCRASSVSWSGKDWYISYPIHIQCFLFIFYSRGLVVI